MTARICIFESSDYRKLLPLVYLRPVWELRLGMFTLRERIERAYPGAEVVLHPRSTLAALAREQGEELAAGRPPGERCLFLNGALVAPADLARRIPADAGEDLVYLSDGRVAAARLGGARLRALWARLASATAAGGAAHPEAGSGTLALEDFDGIGRQAVDAEVIRYPWELVHRNEHAISQDFEALGEGGRIDGNICDGVHLIAAERIRIGEATVVWPSTVLDGESGPIYMGRNVTVSPGAVIRGPVFIGDGCLINPHAAISEGVTIGPVSKVGGEVEATIIQGYSNKQHAGFLGHSYLGEWINLGAGTNNSDLKNNYSSVRVRVDGEDVDSGQMFVGLTMGDHSKTGINSMLNTGTVVGIACNIFGAGFPPKYVPSFSWGGAHGFAAYDLERCIDVARTVMGRRKVVLTPAYEAALRAVFELTRAERDAFRAWRPDGAGQD